MCDICEKGLKVFNSKENTGFCIKENKLIIFKKQSEKLKAILRREVRACPFCSRELFEKETKIYTIEINQKLPSLNDYLNKCKHSIGQAKTFKQDQDDIIGWELKRQKLDNLRIKKPVKAYIHYIEPKRDRDVDNVYSASKYIFDGLQKMGILENDNPKHLIDIKNTIEYDNKTKGKVIVELVEV